MLRIGKNRVSRAIEKTHNTFFKPQLTHWVFVEVCIYKKLLDGWWVDYYLFKMIATSWHKNENKKFFVYFSNTVELEKSLPY